VARILTVACLLLFWALPLRPSDDTTFQLGGGFHVFLPASDPKETALSEVTVLVGPTFMSRLTGKVDSVHHDLNFKMGILFGFLYTSRDLTIGIDNGTISDMIFPLLLCVQFERRGLYYETGLGIGIQSTKLTLSGTTSSHDRISFVYSMGAGYVSEGFDLNGTMLFDYDGDNLSVVLLFTAGVSYDF